MRGKLMPPRQLEEIIEQARHRFGCEYLPLSFTTVTERLSDGTTWRGEVITGELAQEPRRPCYAWVDHRCFGSPRIVLMPEGGAVVGPASAVLVASAPE